MVVTVAKAAALSYVVTTTTGLCYILNMNVIYLLNMEAMVVKINATEPMVRMCILTSPVER
jgi:hypothetical protein